VCVCVWAKTRASRNTPQCLPQLPVVKMLHKSQGVCLDRKYQRLQGCTVFVFVCDNINSNSFSSLNCGKLTCDVNMTNVLEKDMI
jgi:hypothetical protein